MKLLVTGGAGCLGSNIIERYFEKGVDICAIDNFVTGRREVIPQQKNLRVVEGSISDEDLVKKTFSEFRPTHVIHSAASYKDPFDWKTDTETNVIGTINIVEASKVFEVKKLINLQTALCYGRPEKTPISADSPLAPFTSYGISKTAGEAYLLNSSVPFVSLRLANICGPRLSIGPIPTFYKRLKEGKDCFCSEAVRDFLDMEDFFDLIDLILNSHPATGAYNVSTGIGNSILDVFRQVENYLGLEKSDVPLQPVESDDVSTVVLDPSLTETVFNWKAKIDFQTMINNQLQWYDKHGVSEIFSHLGAKTK